jgi:hypothetical protein
MLIPKIVVENAAKRSIGKSLLMKEMGVAVTIFQGVEFI